jgi:hypothetical protein
MAKSDNRLPRIGASLDGLVLKVSLAETCCRCRRTLKPHIERAFGRFPDDVSTRVAGSAPGFLVIQAPLPSDDGRRVGMTPLGRAPRRLGKYCPGEIDESALVCRKSENSLM